MSQMSRDDRTTALGLFNYGRSYRISADYLLSAKLEVTHPHAPMTFLYYHAIELYLKAFLRASDYSVDDLRTVGHNISKLARAVQARGLELGEIDREVLQLVGEGDNVIRSRYIETGAFSRPEEDALSATAETLDEKIGLALAAHGIAVRRYEAKNAASIPSSNFDADGWREELGELSRKERDIIAYLLHHNQRLFTANMDGGHAATLIARGIVRVAVRPGQVFDADDMPMEVPRPIWNLLKEMKDSFPYEGDDDRPYPWRVHWMER